MNPRATIAMILGKSTTKLPPRTAVIGAPTTTTMRTSGARMTGEAMIAAEKDFSQPKVADDSSETRTVTWESMRPTRTIGLRVERTSGDRDLIEGEDAKAMCAQTRAFTRMCAIG
jgi:hypothetical protein